MRVAHREFPPVPEAAGDARVFVRETLDQWAVGQSADDAVLLASELVTNAVIHAESPLEVTVRRLQGAVEVVVADRVPERAVPQAGPLTVDTTPSTDNARNGGLGLALAAAIASSWGVAYSKQDKAVWFRVLDAEDAPAPPLAPPEPVHPPRRRAPRPDRKSVV